MFGRKLIIAAGLITLGLFGVGTQSASAYHPGTLGSAYAAPTPAYTLPVPVSYGSGYGYGSPVYSAPARCATPIPAPVYCPPPPPRPIGYCPPPVVIYRPAPVYRPHYYGGYGGHGRDRVHVSFEYRNRW